MVQVKQYYACLISALFVGWCTASDNMVAVRAAEHQKEVDKKAAAASQAVATIPERHMRDRIRETIAYKAEEFREKTPKDVVVVADDAVDKVTSLIYDYYYQPKNPDPKSRDERRSVPCRAAAYFDSESNGYAIMFGLAYDHCHDRLTIPLIDAATRHESCKKLRCEPGYCSGVDVHHGKYQIGSDFLRTFAQRAHDYAMGQVHIGDDAERKIIMDKAVMDAALPRISLALQVAHTFESADADRFSMDLQHCTLIGCAAYFPHPSLLETIMSLGAEAWMCGELGGRGKGPWRESYADDALPNDHPYTPQARALLFERAQQGLVENREYLKYTEPQIRKAAAAAKNIEGLHELLKGKK